MRKHLAEVELECNSFHPVEKMASIHLCTYLLTENPCSKSGWAPIVNTCLKLYCVVLVKANLNLYNVWKRVIYLSSESVECSERETAARAYMKL